MITQFPHPDAAIFDEVRWHTYKEIELMTNIGHPTPPSDVPDGAGNGFTSADEVAEVQEEAIVAEEIATDE